MVGEIDAKREKLSRNGVGTGRGGLIELKTICIIKFCYNPALVADGF